MVDFAHTFNMEPTDLKDDGYLFGLENLIKLLEQVEMTHRPASPSEEQPIPPQMQSPSKL